MPLFKGRSSLLEVQNRALIKTARERAAQIEKLESDLQRLRESVAQSNKLERELQARLERQIDEIERLTLERDFYSKRASALEEENRELTESATKYSVQAQKLERELTEVATRYSLRAQKLERELTETATKYSLWGQRLERELARIDPDGASARRFDAQQE
jgi:chromosome segregation ATPase